MYRACPALPKRRAKNHFSTELTRLAHRERLFPCCVAYGQSGNTFYAMVSSALFVGWHGRLPPDADGERREYGASGAVSLGKGTATIAGYRKPATGTGERLTFVSELHVRKSAWPIKAQSVLVEPKNMLVL